MVLGKRMYNKSTNETALGVGYWNLVLDILSFLFIDLVPRSEASARADKYICREIRTTISRFNYYIAQRAGDRYIFLIILNLYVYNRAVKTAMVG